MRDRKTPDCLENSGMVISDSMFSTVMGPLDPVALADLTRMSEIRNVKAGEVLMADAQRPAHLGFVLEGVLGMRKVLVDGRAHIIGLLVPTDVYGRLSPRPVAFQVEALTDSKVLCIAQAPLEKFLTGHVEIGRRFLTRALDELDALREWILLLGARKISTRVASFLVILGRRSLRSLADGVQDKTALRVNIPIPRANLAEHLGTTVESLSRALRELQHDGVIEMVDPYNVKILDMNGLLHLAGHVNPMANTQTASQT